MRSAGVVPASVGAGGGAAAGRGGLRRWLAVPCRSARAASPAAAFSGALAAGWAAAWAAPGPRRPGWRGWRAPRRAGAGRAWRASPGWSPRRRPCRWRPSCRRRRGRSPCAKAGAAARSRPVAREAGGEQAAADAGGMHGVPPVGRRPDRLGAGGRLAAGLVPRAAASGSFRADRGGAGAKMAARHDRGGSMYARTGKVAARTTPSRPSPSWARRPSPADQARHRTHRPRRRQLPAAAIPWRACDDRVRVSTAQAGTTLSGARCRAGHSPAVWLNTGGIDD